MTLSLNSENVIVTRKYENKKLSSEKKKFCKDFEEGIATVESMIQAYSKDYDVKEDVHVAAPAKKGAAPKQ
jgi:hypothetical protein